jgi:hypothetical protein
MYLRGDFCELFCTLLHIDRNLDLLSLSGAAPCVLPPNSKTSSSFGHSPLRSATEINFHSTPVTEIKKRLEIIEALQLILYFSIIGRPDALVSLFMIAWPTPCSGKTSP